MLLSMLSVISLGRWLVLLVSTSRPFSSMIRGYMASSIGLHLYWYTLFVWAAHMRNGYQTHMHIGYPYIIIQDELNKLYFEIHI